MRNFKKLTMMLLALTACSAPVKTLPPPSLPPMIQCGEHELLEHLPSYPVAPELDGVSANSYDALRAYSAAQSEWAISASGVFARNNDKFYGVADCLDDARKSHLIQ